MWFIIYTTYMIYSMNKKYWYLFIIMTWRYKIQVKSKELLINVLNVLVSLVQLVRTMHNICKVRNSNSGHHKKKINALNILKKIFTINVLNILTKKIQCAQGQGHEMELSWFPKRHLISITHSRSNKHIKRTNVNLKMYF